MGLPHHRSRTSENDAAQSRGSLDGGLELTPTIGRRRFARIIPAFALLTLLCATALITWLSREVVRTEIPFDMDEADHTTAAIELYLRVLRGNLGEIATAIREQAFYPPMHSFFVALSYLIAGPTLASSRIPSVVMFGLYLAVIAMVSYSLAGHTPRITSPLKMPLSARHFAVLGASLAAAFAITSQVTVTGMVLSMLEPLGLVMVSLLLAQLARMDLTASRGLLPLTTVGLLLVAVSLTKYSFGLMVAPAVGLALLTGSSSEGTFRRRLFSAAFPTLLALALVLIWVDSTDFFGASNFIFGHEKSGPILGAENLLYYPTIWMESYTAHEWCSVVVLVLLVIGAVRYWRYRMVRAACFIILFGITSVTLSTVHEPRHILTATPGLWIVASLGAIHAVRTVLQWSGNARRVGIATLVILLVAFVITGIDSARRLPKQVAAEFEGLRSFYELQLFIAEHVDPSAPIITSSFSDKFGEQSARWLLAAKSGIPYREIQLDSYPYSWRHFLKARKRIRNIDYPWSHPDFPREPFSKVLETGHYRYAVQMQSAPNPSYRGAPAKEFREALTGYPSKERQIGTWRVVIWDLQPKSPPT